MSLTTKWAPYFDGRVRMRGRAYCNQGRVEPQQPKDGELFRASVQGQADRPYYVVFKGENELDEVSCTCVRFAEGHYCRHIWAALLYMQQLDEPAGAVPGALSSRACLGHAGGQGSARPTNASSRRG